MTDTDKCPNCGAPRRGAVCEYCGTRFNDGVNRINMNLDLDYTNIRDMDGSIVYRLLDACDVDVIKGAYR